MLLTVQGGVEILLVASSYRNQDKLWPDGPLGSYTDFTFTFTKGTLLLSVMLLACVTSVSVGFGSKERPKNGIFGVFPARKMGREPKTNFFAPEKHRKSRFSDIFLFPTPTETLATQASMLLKLVFVQTALIIPTMYTALIESHKLHQLQTVILRK